MAYRSDIDGMRGIAVLAVVAYHTAPSFVPGGFVGVDIFFVISGFLISTLLLTEASRGGIDLAGFYLRRIRRLFPALLVVLAACWAIGWAMLSQDEYRELEKHIASASVFASNVTLWSEAGYFDTTSDLKPLLHLWSLGIEEQFYLLWPTLLAFAWRRRLNLGAVATLAIAASFLLNVALIGRSVVATFFLPHTRLWQLMVGALAAHVIFERRVRRPLMEDSSLRPQRALRSILDVEGMLPAVIGVTLIVIAIVGLGDGVNDNRLLSTATSPVAGGLLGVTRENPYPGIWAILPTLGSVLMINAGAGAWLNRKVLAWRPLVFVGLVSYPLYLWHWPLLSFVRIAENGRPSVMLRLAAVLVSAGLAWLTYVAVERPIRRTTSEDNPRPLLALAVMLLAVGGAAFYAWRTDSGTSRLPDLATRVERFPSPRFEAECRERFHYAGEYCQQYAPEGRITTVLMGDSHAWHFFRGVGSRLSARGDNVALLGQHACPPLDDIDSIAPDNPDRCRNLNRPLIDSVANDATVTRVLLAFRGSAYVSQAGGDAIQLSLERTLKELSTRNKEIWILLEVPELGFNVLECIARPFSFEHVPRNPCAVPKADVLERQAPYRAIVREMEARFPNLHVFDPLPFLCDDHRCVATRGGTLLYLDDHHLSMAGSLSLADAYTF